MMKQSDLKDSVLGFKFIIVGDSGKRKNIPLNIFPSQTNTKKQKQKVLANPVY